MKYTKGLRARLIMILSSVLVVFLLFRCGPGPLEPIPISDDYPSDGYAYTLTLDSLPDTMYTAKFYHMPWHDVGKDLHWTFRAITNDSDVVDSANLHYPKVGREDSLLNLYFLKEYTDSMYIEGIMWNLNPSYRIGFPVTVTERFTITVDSSTLGSDRDVEIAVGNSRPFPSDSLLSVIWYVNGDRADSGSLSHVFTRSVGISDELAVTAQIVNRVGIRKNLGPLSLKIQPEGLPSVSIEAEKIVVPLNKPYTLSAKLEHADSVHWIGTQGIDTTVAGGLLTHTWTDPSSDTVIAAATNVYGTAFDTVFVVPRMFEYDLSIAAFPNTAQAGQWTTWEVAVERNGQPVPDNQVTYHWSMTGDTAVDSIRTEGGKREMYFRYEKEFVLSVFAEIGSDTTWRHSGVVTVVPDPMIPRVTGLDPDSAWYNTETRLVIFAEDNSAVTGYSVSFDNMEFSEWSGDSVYTHSFSDSGVQYVYVRVRDDDGNESMVFGDSVYLLPGYPSVTEIDLMVEDDSVFVLDTISYSITAIDPNKKVRMVYANWDGGTVARDSVEVDADSVTVSIKHAFDLSDSGEQTVSVWCRDDDGLVSEPVSKTITLRVGRPTVSVEFPETVFINVSNEYQVTANDTNGAIEQYAVSWNGGEFITQTEGVFARAFADAGEKIVRAYVTDNDGISSDTVSKTVIVTLGEPAFTSITTDSLLSSLYILDPITWTITGTDPNGSVDSVLVSWDGDTIFESRAKAESGSATVAHSFSRTASGSRTVLFRLMDNDGLATDSVFTVEVRLAAPVIDSLVPDSAWVLDNNTYTVFAHDTNSTILDSFEIDWNNDGTYDAKNATGIFSHSFDTSRYGEQGIKVRVMDEDSVWSEKVLTVKIRLGRPVVSGASFGDSIQWVEGENGALDTMFYVYEGGDVQVIVDTTDTNGRIVQYYWDLDTNGQNGPPTTDPQWTINGLLANQARVLRVYGKDDDDIFSLPFTFIVFPDEPPPAPVVNYSDAQKKFSWSGKDVKDADATLYKIISKKGSSPDESANIVQDFLPGTSYESGAPLNDYSFSYAPTAGTGKYYYQVIAKDARGSTTKSTVNNFDYIE